MAKNEQAVTSFLSELAPGLQQLWKSEREVLLTLKEAEMGEMGLPFTRTINKEDFW